MTCNDCNRSYYYTKYPQLCCVYDLVPISNTVKAWDFKAAIAIINNHYKDIKCDHYRKLLQSMPSNDLTLVSNTMSDQIMLEYLKFRPNSYCLTIWPHYNKDLASLVKFLTKFGYVYYVKQISLTHNAAVNLVYQLYSDTARFPTIDKLKEKVMYLGFNSTPKDIKVIFFENTSDEHISGSQSILKTKIRTFLLDELGNKDLRGDDLVHINDHYYQTVEYAQIYLHKKSLSFLKRQDLSRYMTFKMCRTFVNTTKNWIIKNVDTIDQNRILLFGSSILYTYGVRGCRDVDGLMLGGSNVDDKVARYFYTMMTRFPFGSIGIMNTRYWKGYWDKKDIPWFNMLNITHRDEMIFDPKHYYYFNGLKFSTLKVEIAKKMVRGKFHDYGDMLQMMEILSIKIRLPQLSPQMVQEMTQYLKEKYDMNDDSVTKLINKYITFPSKRGMMRSIK